MTKIVFVTHEFGNFKGHGGIAEYLNVLVTQILKRHVDYEIHIITIACNEKSNLLNDRKLFLYELKPESTHEMGKKVLNYLKMIKPDIVECADYMSLCLEALCYRYETEKNELSNTKFITVHHTASRECFEWSDKIPVKYASGFIRECFLREKTQMKLSDLNIAPSNFMRKYVMKNYCLEDVVTVLNPLTINVTQKEILFSEVEKNCDLDGLENKFVISCISRIEGRKNQELLVRQFIKFLDITGEDAVLILAGNSSINSITGENLVNEIFDLIPENYISHIHFYDFMSYEEKKKIYLISDVFVLASVYENLPLALIEAVSHEVPVIISRYCGFVDCIGDTVETMSFHPFLTDDLCDKILTFYKLDEEQRHNILIKQKNSLIKQTNYEKTVDMKLVLYDSVTVEQKKKLHHTLLIDKNNYLTIIDENILSKDYDGIMVSFYHNLQCTEILRGIFESVAEKFEDGAIICYSANFPQFEYKDVISNWIPFYLKGVELNRMTGKRLVDVVSYYGCKGELYNLLDEMEGLVDKIVYKMSDESNIKRDSMWKKLLGNCLHDGLYLSLEDRYEE